MEFNHQNDGNEDDDQNMDQNSFNQNNNSDENSCDENGMSGSNPSSGANGQTRLKRKRLCDIAYTAEITFESQFDAVKYVDSLNVWKFERNRPTKKGAKGFYHCRLSENCKSKIYLLSDLKTGKVVLYQNNIDHEHDPNAPPITSAYLMEIAAKKSRLSLSTSIHHNQSPQLDTNEKVDIVNDNDFEDSFVDFFDNDDDNNENENDETNINNEENNNYSNATNPYPNNHLLNSTTTNIDSLNSSFMNYTLERTFETRSQANEYLIAMYNGIWKFERTRPTKTGAKCFYKCKVSKDCKSKCYILSMPNTDEVVLYKNNIEHDHNTNTNNTVNPTLMPKTTIINNTISKEEILLNQEDAAEDSFEFGPINCMSGDENTNDYENNDNPSQSQNQNSNTNGKAKRRSTNLVNRIELTYTPEESFENRRLANEFIDSLSIWKFQRTRSTKKGAKCFYVCKLSDNCKSKIYVLSNPDSEAVTVFRNNIDHDHSQPKKLAETTNNGGVEAGAGETIIENIIENDENEDAGYENSFFNNNNNNNENENEDDVDISSYNTPNGKSKNASMVGARFEFNYSAEEKFENRLVASKFIDSLGVWKFERNRPTKKGSKGFYHCKVSDSCKSKIYLLSQPSIDEVTLFRNNIEHDHTGQSATNTTSNNITNTNNNSQTSGLPASRANMKTILPGTQLRENQNSVNYFQRDEETGPLKYFINNPGMNNNDDEDEEEENDHMYGSESMDGSENFFSNNNHTTNNNHHNGNTANNGEVSYFDEDSDDINMSGRKSMNNMNRFELVYTTDKTFENRQLANEYIKQTNIWKFQRTRCTKKGAKCFYMCKQSKICKSKMYVLTQPNTDRVILYINNIEHDHSSSSQTVTHNNGVSQFNGASNGKYFNHQNHNHFTKEAGIEENTIDQEDDLIFNEESNDFFNSNNNNGEENFFSDDDNKSKTSSTISSNQVPYTAEETFENKQEANAYIESLGMWKFDRIRDTKSGAKGYYQCKMSEYCKSKIYLLFHPDAESVTLYKNNTEHDHVKRMGLKKWGLSVLTKKVIDQVYLNGNTTPMSCMLKLRAIIKAKTDKINVEKLKGNDVSVLQAELDQLEEPEMTVLKNYINNTLKPRLNGNGQREVFNGGSSVDGDVNSVNSNVNMRGELNGEELARCQKENDELSQRIVNLEMMNKKLQEELNVEREQKKDILNQLEIANNTIENLKLPNDSLIDMNESKEIQLKKQRTTIELLQKRIDELTAKKENSLNNQNNNISSMKMDKLICDNEVCEYY